MKARDFSYTYGALDGAVLTDGRVSASGWVVGLEDDIAGLRVESDGDVLTIDEVKFKTPSPDVQQMFPNIRHTGNCRFKVTARLPGHLVSSGGARLLSIVPITAEGKRGVPLERIVPLQLAVPRPDQSALVGHGDFIETSFSMLSLFRLVAGLKRDAHILDPGCGIGRIAFGLYHYLDQSGRYTGFDISEKAIELAKSIFPAHSSFSFEHVDLYNTMYNSAATARAADFAFPFPAENFDFIVMTSVFTHLLPDEANHYLREISRTLISGGSCFATFFALDDIAKANLTAKSASLDIVHPLTEGCFVQDRNVPESAVAYDYELLSHMVAEAGLAIEEVHWGLWSAHDPFLSYQDILLLRKPSSYGR